jgi:hypothetical protein
MQSALHVLATLYLGWHSRLASNPAMDNTCLYASVSIVLWLVVAQTKVAHAYGVLCLAFYLAVHALRRHTLHRTLALGVFNVLFFLLSLVLPDPRVVFSTWALLLFVMGLRALPNF